MLYGLSVSLYDVYHDPDATGQVSAGKWAIEAAQKTEIETPDLNE